MLPNLHGAFWWNLPLSEEDMDMVGIGIYCCAALVARFTTLCPRVASTAVIQWWCNRHRWTFSVAKCNEMCAISQCIGSMHWGLQNQMHEGILRQSPGCIYHGTYSIWLRWVATGKLGMDYHKWLRHSVWPVYKLDWDVVCTFAECGSVVEWIDCRFLLRDDDWKKSDASLGKTCAHLVHTATC